MILVVEQPGFWEAKSAGFCAARATPFGRWCAPIQPRSNLGGPIGRGRHDDRDLKNPASLLQACEGVSAVITTASSTFSRQEGDSIETVDRQGQLHLIDAAERAGVRQFVYISIPPDAPYDCRSSEPARGGNRAGP